MKKASANPSPVENPDPMTGTPPAPNIRWTWRKIMLLIVLALVVHIALIFFFGTKKQIVPRQVTKVPRLQLAGDADPLVALVNPALFALPNSKDFGSAIWLGFPRVTPPSFRWNEQPQWLPLDTEILGATFQQSAQTNVVTEIQLEVKPPPEVSATPRSIGSAMPESSTLKILGNLAQRFLPGPDRLPSLPFTSVIPPSKIQVLVDTAGNVVSAVLLPLTDGVEAGERCDPADQRALEIARQLRFTTARQLTLGEIIFKWHTVPMPANNPQTISP
jgi:hypothetical protein